MTDIPNDQQIERFEAVAKGKIRILQVLADTVAQGDPASSGWLRQHCGLSAKEWHGAGELLASLIFFASENGFLEWHAKTMLGEDDVQADER